MPRGEEDEIVARCAPLLVLGELFLGELLFGELLVRELLVRELLASRFFLGCRTLNPSLALNSRTRAELISIRRFIVMHMGFAVRTHASHQVPRELKVAGERAKLRDGMHGRTRPARFRLHPR
jgi:hypothetical protein